MTTPQPAALPELPQHFHKMVMQNKLPSLGFDLRLYTADQMRAYALAALQSQPAAAGVSDAEIDRICYLATEIRFAKTDDAAQAVIDKIRAILALRPQAVPVGFINKPIVWESRQSEMIVKITSKAQPAYGFTHPIYAESPRPQAVPMTELPDFDELPDDAIDNACAAGGIYRADLMRAWESLRADGITAQGAQTKE